MSAALINELADVLRQAVARVELANAQGNPIMSAWVPWANMVLAKVPAGAQRQPEAEAVAALLAAGEALSDWIRGYPNPYDGVAHKLVAWHHARNAANGYRQPALPIAEASPLRAALEARGYGFHGGAEEHDGLYWWTLLRSGWLEAEVGEDCAAMDDAVRDAAVHAMAEGDQFMRKFVSECAELGMADEDASVNGGDLVAAMAELLCSVERDRPELFELATGEARPQSGMVWVPGPYGLAYYLDAEGYLAAVRMDGRGEPDWTVAGIEAAERVCSWSRPPMTEDEALDLRQRIMDEERAPA